MTVYLCPTWRFGHPVVVTPDHELIAGERRLEAYKRLGIPLIPITAVDIDSIVAGELAENTVRKDFLPSEGVAIFRAAAEAEEQRAQARMKSGKPCGKFPQGDTGKSRDKAAAATGKSGRTMEKATAIVQALAGMGLPPPEGWGGMTPFNWAPRLFNKGVMT